MKYLRAEFKTIDVVKFDGSNQDEIQTMLGDHIKVDLVEIRGNKMLSVWSERHGAEFVRIGTYVALGGDNYFFLDEKELAHWIPVGDIL